MKNDLEMVAAMLDKSNIKYDRYNSSPSPFSDHVPAGGGLTIAVHGPVFLEFNADASLYSIGHPKREPFHKGSIRNMAEAARKSLQPCPVVERGLLRYGMLKESA